MVFKAGGHYAYSNYASTVNKAVTELLCKVCSCSEADTSNGDSPIDEMQMDEKRYLKLMLANSQEQQQQQNQSLPLQVNHQQQANRQKVTLITNSSIDDQIKRHFKW